MKKRKKVKDSKLKIILLAFILLFAFFIRIINLGVPSMWIDETYSANVASSILQTGLPHWGNGDFYDAQLVFHYLQAGFISLSQTDFFARLISVFFGLATIFLFYKFGKEYSSSAGLFSAALAAVFFLEVIYSRQARMYQMLQFFFFLTIYLIYKIKDNKNFFYLALVSFFISVDTHVMSLVLVFPFIYLLFSNYKKFWPWLSLLLIPFIYFFNWLKYIILNSLKILPPRFSFNFLSLLEYSIPLFIVSIFGIYFAYLKNKKLTLLTFLPSLILLVGLIFMNKTSLRYLYFFIFPVLLFSGVFFSHLFEKYGKKIVVIFLFFIFLTSNLVIGQNYATVLSPISAGLPTSIEWVTNYRAIPAELKSEILNNTLIVLFSPDVEWNIKKPDYVLSPMPRSTRGIYDCRVCSGYVCERNSGAPVLSAYHNNSVKIPERPYYVMTDSASLRHLAVNSINLQRQLLNNTLQNCLIKYNETDLVVYGCF